jgi:hypothetical protein
MILRKIIIIIISYYISDFFIIEKKHYDINYFAIEKFKEEQFRCIRYIDNRNLYKKANNKIVNMISKYPYTKCSKYKNEYINYIINKNKIIIYNTLINIIFYINIIFL